VTIQASAGQPTPAADHHQHLFSPAIAALTENEFEAIAANLAPYFT
jgi:hypothetical protein